MIYERVVTLHNPKTLVEITEAKAKREFDLHSFFMGAITVAIVLGLLGGFAIRAIANEVTPPPAEPQKMDGKLEIPSATVLSLLETVEIGQPEQEMHAWDVPLTDEELATLLEACEAGHICPSIGLGLIQVESSFRADALNERSGCYGYCQLNPQYFHTGLSPVDNIRTGIEYLAYQLERYDGDLEAALTAYNAGYDTGDRTYATKVLEAAVTFERR